MSESKLDLSGDGDFASIAQQAVKNRRYLHAHPQIAYEETVASVLVQSSLDNLGLEYRVMADTGIVVDIVGKVDDPSRVMALRADMDALPIHEKTGLPHASQKPGFMHACGHDGHTAMLLGAVELLAQTRDFKGRVRAIFQPAEEGAGGAKKMVKAGCFDGMDEHHPVFAFHNWPSLPLGSVATSSGPIMAAADYFNIVVKGQSGHVGMPDIVVNPVPVAASLVSDFEGVKNDLNRKGRVVSFESTQFVADAGIASTVPGEVKLSGSVRSLDFENREAAREAITQLCEERKQDGIDISLEYLSCADPTINTPAAAAFSVSVAEGIFDAVDGDASAAYTAEDFGYMLRGRQGAYIWIGQGTGDVDSPHDQVLHADGYDFNDDVIPLGIRYWCALVQKALPLEGESAYPGFAQKDLG